MTNPAATKPTPKFSPLPFCLIQHAYLKPTDPICRNGSPRDRGGSDSYYRNGRGPHWWPEGTHVGERVEESDMTEQEIREYHAGFDENEKRGWFKLWDPSWNQLIISEKKVELTVYH